MLKIMKERKNKVPTWGWFVFILGVLVGVVAILVFSDAV